MAPLLTILSILFSGSADAGTVALQTDAAVEVKFGDATIARAEKAGELTIGELPEGPVTLRLIRAGLSPMDAAIDVPRNGTTTLKLAGDTLTIEGQVSKLQPLQNPIVVLKPVEDQRFTIVINGQDRRQITQDTIVEDLSPGIHQIEFRSADQLLVWVRGTLELKPGDTVSLTIEEGRMVSAEGQTDAWKAVEGL